MKLMAIGMLAAPLLFSFGTTEVDFPLEKVDKSTSAKLEKHLPDLVLEYYACPCSDSAANKNPILILPASPMNSRAGDQFQQRNPAQAAASSQQN